jgi:hypothetical protein
MKEKKQHKLTYKNDTNFLKLILSNYYTITANGDIYLTKNMKKLKGEYTKDGYLRIYNEKYKKISAHRLIWMYHNKIIIPYGMEINHIDGNKLNNNIQNLEVVTPSQNIQHSIKIGLKKTGVQSKKSKLTEKDVKKIRKLFSKKEKTIRQLALDFNVHKSTISDCIHGTTYVMFLVLFRLEK